MSAFASLSKLELQRIWDGVHGRAVHGDRITLGVIELDPDKWCRNIATSRSSSVSA